MQLIVSKARVLALSIVLITGLLVQPAVALASSVDPSAKLGSGYTQAQKEAPDIHYKRALGYMLINQYDKALEELNQAVNEAPDKAASGGRTATTGFTTTRALSPTRRWR